MDDKNINKTYPLSPMQQGMLFHSRIAPGSGVDIEQIIITLEERVDIDIFKSAWQNVIKRHPILRTSFIQEESSEPKQQVQDFASLQFEYHDLCNKSKEEQNQKLNQFFKQDRLIGFNFSVAPLMRVTLFRLEEEKFECVWTFHHIIIDGRSHPIILNEVFEFYDAALSGKTIDLPLPKPFEEFIKWFQTYDIANSESFWRSYLQGFKSSTPLNFHKIDLDVQQSDEKYQVIHHYLKKDITESLIKFSKDNDVTPYTLILGAWSLLLSRYSGESDILFGATRAGRKSTVDGSENMVGCFINTLPVRVELNSQHQLVDWLKKLRTDQYEIREFEHTPLMNIQNWSELKGEKHLFESILIFENYLLDSHFRSRGGRWLNRQFRILEQTNYPITLFGYLDAELYFKLQYDKKRFSDDSMHWLLKHLEETVKQMISDPNRSIGEINFVTQDEKDLLLDIFNQTDTLYDHDICLHQLFEKKAETFCNKIALMVKENNITYQQLNKLSNQLAHKLLQLGLNRGAIVGVCTDRSIEMLVAILGVHKAGGTYLPLDPNFPKDRIQFMASDAEITVLITQPHLKNFLSDVNVLTIELDTNFSAMADQPDQNPALDIKSTNLCYLIYTSGSTGKPKGVKVTHRNVVNFFTAMDNQISYDKASVWLAVTSLSFDISVLELLWTLTRGLKVVIYTGEDIKAGQQKNQEISRTIDFSLFYFSSYEGEKNTNKYHLLLEGSKYADKNNFTAVWTPERHFYDFGGLYPNPSITSAAIAAVTEKIKIRAGSVVSPLHNTIRIAEEWSMVDNLSHGRVGVSFAAGWQPNDFVIKPENFKDRKDLMFRQIEEVQKLWQGEKVGFTNPNGKVIEINILPKPVQEKLPVWVTAAGNPETFEMAGRLGHNLLTHLLGQSISELAEKISIYRKAWKEAGHKGKGILTLMLHTFVGTDEKMVKETVRGPMKHYLKSSVNLVKEAAWSFPVFKNATTGTDGNFSLDHLSSEDLDAVLDYSFERYYQTSGLFGTPESCKKIIKNLKETDVDEIACLIDFGVDSDLVMAHLHYLNQVRREANIQAPVSAGENKYTISSLIKEQKVTHMQCTPSMAQMLMLDEESKESLRTLQTMLIGGEAFPVKLAESLMEVVKGDILNMYGPTETTVWSTVYRLKEPVGKTIPIGKPIANTQIYILDSYRQLVPVGIPGELCIGGDGVTEGYYNRPALTAEKFIDNPFSKEENSKLYRTGDLAYYRKDGTIEFLGRLDHQVKIRGYRIELGEIETLLSSHEDIREAVVIAREDTPGDVRLTAYMIWKNGEPKEISEIKEYLKEKLPEYMIPSQYLGVESFPLTPNGKIDRKAFPVYSEFVKDTVQKEIVLPTNEMEDRIATVWKELLKLPKVGINDNFFDIGGHSLLAVQLHAKLKVVVDPELTLIDIFTYPSIRSLEEFVNKKLNSGDETITVQNSKRAEMSKQRINRLKSRNRDKDDNTDIQVIE